MGGIPYSEYTLIEGPFSELKEYFKINANTKTLLINTYNKEHKNEMEKSHATRNAGYSGPGYTQLANIKIKDIYGTPEQPKKIGNITITKYTSKKPF